MNSDLFQVGPSIWQETEAESKRAKLKQRKAKNALTLCNVKEPSEKQQQQTHFRSLLNNVQSLLVFREL